MKTSELSGPALDWAVAKLEGDLVPTGGVMIQTWPYYATNWAHGGPVIEREKISVALDEGETEWEAVTEAALGSMFGTGLRGEHWQQGPTPLIAAMRCFVESKLGNEIDIPEELV
jgi:hypothetical protein